MAATKAHGGWLFLFVDILYYMTKDENTIKTTRGRSACGVASPKSSATTRGRLCNCIWSTDTWKCVDFYMKKTALWKSSLETLRDFSLLGKTLSCYSHSALNIEIAVYLKVHSCCRGPSQFLVNWHMLRIQCIPATVLWVLQEQVWGYLARIICLQHRE